jgi:hypothetical protein
MDLSNLVATITTAIAVIFAIVSIIGAMRAGVLTHLRLGNLIELKASPQERERARELVRAAQPGREDVPYETEQLALYYGQILGQSKISFWFSLIFASLGFGVIVVAVFLYSGSEIGKTMAQFAAGTVMDAVAALFFVQSRNAQKSMGEFFDKLRRDRQQLESRRLCEQLEVRRIRDALRVVLSLHYAEVENASEVAKNVTNAGGLPQPAMPATALPDRSATAANQPLQPTGAAPGAR